MTRKPKAEESATNPKGSNLPSDHAESAQKRHSLHGRAPLLSISKAYRIAGLVVAAYRSTYHHLLGDLQIVADDDHSGNLRVDPGKILQVADGRTSNEFAALVQAEREVILMSGHQSELIHYTLHMPAESEQVIDEMNQVMASGRKAATHDTQRVISDALGLVTHHWHEIECLAVWLMRQEQEALPVSVMVQEIERIHPEDQGMFP